MPKVECDGASITKNGKDEVTGEAINPYSDSYRLRDINGQPGMIVPRPSRLDIYENLEDFALCFDCHNPYAVLGTHQYDSGQTNFWNDDGKTRNAHNVHIQQRQLQFDSDWDGLLADSRTSCIACHNVHGSSTGAMIRDGKLINKEPALNFCYLTSWVPNDPPGNKVCGPAGTEAWGSVGGWMDIPGQRIVDNGVCNSCHSPNKLDLAWNRTAYHFPKVIGGRGTPDTLSGDGGTTLISASVVDAYGDFDPSSTLLLDLSPLGLVNQEMNDDGADGDVQADDGIYSCEVTIPSGTSPGTVNLTITATDTAGNPGLGNATLLITPPFGLYIIDNSDSEPAFTLAVDPGDPSDLWDCGVKSGGYPPDGDQRICWNDAGNGVTENSSATWRPYIDESAAGNYRVYAWWHEYYKFRATDAPYTIHYGTGQTITVRVNQTTDGSQWNELTSESGPLPFPAPGTYDYKVVLSDDADDYVIADAIKFELQP